MEKKMIKVLVKEPNKEPYTTEIEDELEPKQAIVGGLIECIEFPDLRGVDIYVNEEGLLDQLPGNFWLPHYQDCVKGTCFMVGFDAETGDCVDITDNQIKHCEKFIKTFEIPQELDLYSDFGIIEEIMKSRYKRYLKNMSEM